MNGDLIYGIGDSHVHRAALVFEGSVDAQWPLDTVNEALYKFYEANDSQPWIYVAQDNDLPVGYVVTERDDFLTDQDVLDAFYGMLEEQGQYDTVNQRFTETVPFATNGEWDDLRVGIAAYPQRSGPSLPLQPINNALTKLTGHGETPYLYPVRKGTSGYDGIIFMAAVDDFALDPGADDAIVKELTKQNKARKLTGFEIERYDIS